MTDIQNDTTTNEKAAAVIAGVFTAASATSLGTALFIESSKGLDVAENLSTTVLDLTGQEMPNNSADINQQAIDTTAVGGLGLALVAGLAFAKAVGTFRSNKKNVLQKSPSVTAETTLTAQQHEARSQLTPVSVMTHSM